MVGQKTTDGAIPILGHITNLPGQDQEQCDLLPELALTSNWPHFDQEVGPETSKGPLLSQFSLNYFSIITASSQ